MNEPNRQEMTAAGTAMGTADYVSPEQVTDSHSVDIRSDIYSLGCTLYKLLSGRAPFVGPEFKNDVTKMMAHLNSTPPPISLLRTDLPPGLAAVVERMMAKKPEDRFATPGQVAAALEPFAVGANLDRLLNEANGMLGLPTLETPHSASTGKLSASAHVDTDIRQAAGVPQPQAASARRWPPRSITIGLTAVAASFLLIALGVIVIRIRDKSGRETVINAPPGSTVTLEEDGKKVGQVPTSEKEIKGQSEQPPTQSLTIGKPIARPKPLPLNLTPKPLDLPEGAPMSKLALVARPAPLPGVRSWTIETRENRGTIWNLEYSPDGTQLLAASQDGTVRIWDVSDGHLVRALVGAGAPAMWSPDGSVVAAASPRNAINSSFSRNSWRLALTPTDGIHIWDPKTCQIQKTIPVRFPIHAMDWSPDGRLISTTGLTDPPYFGTVILDVQTGSTVQLLPLKHGPGLRPRTRWSPDGSVLAETSKDGIRRWHVLTREYLPALPLESAEKDVHWSADGRLLLASSGKKSRVWESDSGKLVRELDERATGWSPDGTKIATLGTDGRLALVSADDDESNPVVQRMLTNEPQRLVWSPDGKLMATVGQDTTISILDAQSGQLRAHISVHPNPIRLVKWSPDDTTLLVGCRDEFHTFDTRSGRRLRTFARESEMGQFAEWSPDGKTIAANVYSITLWNAETGKSVRVFQPRANWYARAWSPDGKRLAAVNQKEVQIWNTENGEPVKTLPSPPGGGASQRLVWSPDGRRLAASGSGDSALSSGAIWNVESGNRIGTTSGVTNSVAFSPDGATLCGGVMNGDIKFFAAESAILADSVRMHQAPVCALHWTRDGKIITGGEDGTIREYDCRTRMVLGTVSGIVPEVFSTSGRYVGWPHQLQSHESGVVCAQIWNTETGQPRGTIVLLRDDAWLTVSPSGHYRGSPGVERQLIYVVQTDEGQQTLTPEEFSQKYGWKNDPEQVKLGDESDTDGHPSSP